VHRLVQATGTAEQVDHATVVLHPRGDTILCHHEVVVPQAMLGETGGVAASREDATWPTWMLLFRGLRCTTWQIWRPEMHFQGLGAYGAPRDKFRRPEMYFQSLWTYVTHAYKFRSLWCI
jgi:hypothetical protein